MKIALVHDQIAEFGGAERVLISLKKAFPDADVYTSFVDKARLGDHWEHFKEWNITQSWASRIPFFNKLYSPLRFLLPSIWRSFDLSSYDAVICSSSWGMCKGVSLHQSTVNSHQSSEEIKSYKPTGLHAYKPLYFCYLHTPPRYLYGYDESSLKRYWPVKLYALIVNHFLRQYDFRSSQTIDQFIFNSEEVRRRSLKFYRKDGVVIHPPILLPRTTPTRLLRLAEASREGWQACKPTAYYLTVSRLAPTKHIDVIVKAANEAKFNLKIVGTGKEWNNLKEIAGPTVELLGSVSDEKLNDLYAGAKAFIYASVNEDFGMVPVEAMAHGTPVIAYASGGVLETVHDAVNGFLFHELTPQSLIEAIHVFDSMTDKDKENMCHAAHAFAETCTEDRFIEGVRKMVAKKVV